MPRGSAPFRSHESYDFADDFVTRGAISIGSVGGVRCLISYSVPVGLLVLLGVVSFAADRPGSTADLPPSALLATAFWASGWVVQAAFFLGLSKVLGAPATYLRVGLLGVESMPRVWSVNQAGLVSIATLIPMLLLGMLYRLIEGGFTMPQLAPAEQAVWLPPSVGLKSHESIWLTGAWLCWVQVVLQMIPFPRTPGRHLLAAMVVGMGRSLPPPIQVRLLRQMLIVVSIGFVVMSLLLHSSDNSGLASKWPLLLLGGILMFISSRRVEVTSLVDGLRQGQSSLGHLPRDSWIHRTRHSLAQRRDRVPKRGVKGPSATEILKTLAITRIILDNVDHIQSFWIDNGPEVTQISLHYGVDDINGTMIEETIAHESGAKTKTYETSESLIGWIQSAGLRAAERDCRFQVISEA